jgi:CubicO group peptidase (beta-lactamase class C family)
MVNLNRKYRQWSKFNARIGLILWLTVTLGLVVINRVDAQVKDRAVGRIPPETIAIWLEENQVPTVGIGIIENGSLQEAKVYGKQQRNIPATANTIFNVASLTKPLVAMLTLILVSRHQWQLDEPLARYWVDPDVKDNPWHKELTTRHVLSQQSGFVNWRWDHPTKHLTFDLKPGSRFGYSGEGFEYLQRALEAKFNQTLEHLADSVLCKPLGMNDTYFYWNGSVDSSRFAFEHNTLGHLYPTHQRTESSAADDLLTTIGDYGRFSAAVLNGTGLSKAVFQEMITPQAVVDSGKHLFWGLGFELINDLSTGEYALFHGGSDRGVRTAVILLPASECGLVIFTNGDKGGEVIRKIAIESLKVGKEIAERLK